MSCAYEEDMTAFVDRELPELRMRQVEQHLVACAGCQTTVSLLRKTVRQLEGMPAFEPSIALRGRVLSAIATEPAPSRWRQLAQTLRPSVWIPAGALGVAALVAMMVARPPSAIDLLDARELEVASHLELLEELDVVGLESPDDLDVVAMLHELEGEP
jgi:anti-sigma factor RsiW